jgi:hypothetical protein
MLKEYDVTVTRTGGVSVKAESEEQAVEMVRSMSATEINEKGNLTGWETSDAELISKKREEIYYNTKEKGGIVAYESNISEVNSIAIEVGRDNSVTFLGMYSTYDNKKYMFFRIESQNSNYAVEVTSGKSMKGVKVHE